MADSGKNSSFIFAGQTYDSDDCLQGWDLNQAVADATYLCDGYEKHAGGAKTISFTVSMALAATDSTKLSYLVPGTTGTFTAYPAGLTTNYIEVTSTKATIITSNVTAPINGFIAADVTIGVDDLTVGKA
jgi:hypothetical protein